MAAATKDGITLLAFSPSTGWEPLVEVPTDLDPASLTLGDVNNDGLTDIVAGGKRGASVLYTTRGAYGLWVEEVILEGDRVASVDLADANGDGFLDVAVGRQAKDAPLVYLFTPLWGEDLDARPVPHAWTAEALPEGFDLANVRQVAFADLDGSGAPGLFCVTEQANQSMYLQGDGAGGLLETGRTLPGNVTAVAVGDMNLDGALDFAAVGNKTLDVYEGFFEEVPEERSEAGEGGASNEAPTAPVMAGATVQNGALEVAWYAASDDRTAAASLTYEVVAGTSPEAMDLLIAEIGPQQTSSRRGIAQTSTRARVPFPPGAAEVYWGVQAVDAAHVRGPWLRAVTWADGTTVVLEGAAAAVPEGALPRGDARTSDSGPARRTPPAIRGQGQAAAVSAGEDAMPPLALGDGAGVDYPQEVDPVPGSENNVAARDLGSPLGNWGQVLFIDKCHSRC